MTFTSEPCALAIDLGTSGAKVALVAAGDGIVDWSFAPIETHVLPGSGVEQDPDDWWRAVVAATREVTTRNPAATEAVVAVGCTGQWSGTVPVDAGGRALSRALIWMDGRGADLVRELVGGVPHVQGYAVHKLARWIRLTGGAPEKSGKGPVAHIAWLKHNRPDLYERAATFLEPKDYLNLRLSGKAAAGFDSIALHWVTDNRDPANVRYADRLVHMARLDRSKLPELRPATAILGSLLEAPAGELGLLPGIPIAMGTPDLHSAALGSGAVADYATHLYLGTSSWLVAHVPFKKTDLLHNMASLPAALPGRYLLANEQESAGACLVYLADSLEILPPGLTPASRPEEVFRGYDIMAEAAEPGSGGIIFAPWLNGERTPIEDSRIRGGFLNLSLRATTNDLVRAVFEGVAFNTRWLLGYVDKFLGRSADPIRIIGGGARSDVWCQIYADILGRVIQRVKRPRLANLRGVGRLALLSVGSISATDLENNVPIAATFHPNAALRRRYDSLYREFLAFQRATRRIQSRLDDRNR